MRIAIWVMAASLPVFASSRDCQPVGFADSAATIAWETGGGVIDVRVADDAVFVSTKETLSRLAPATGDTV